MVFCSGLGKARSGRRATRSVAPDHTGSSWPRRLLLCGCRYHLGLLRDGASSDAGVSVVDGCGILGPISSAACRYPAPADAPAAAAAALASCSGQFNYPDRSCDPFLVLCAGTDLAAGNRIPAGESSGRGGPGRRSGAAGFPAAGHGAKAGQRFAPGGSGSFFRAGVHRCRRHRVFLPDAPGDIYNRQFGRPRLDTGLSFDRAGRGNVAPPDETAR